MKQILLMRHAKSSWKDLHQADIDRPLNKRGKRDAPIMGAELKRFFPAPEVIYCSTAQRTRDTLDLIIPSLPALEIQYEKNLYHGSIADYEASIYGTDDLFETVLLVGHNPTTTYAASLAGADIDNVATSGIVYIQAEIDSWTEFSFDQASFIKYIFPKLFI